MGENADLQPSEEQLNEDTNIDLDDAADTFYPSVTEEILSQVW